MHELLFNCYVMILLCYYSLCKGSTLYSLLHVLKEKFQLNKAVIVASQIAQVKYENL